MSVQLALGTGAVQAPPLKRFRRPSLTSAALRKSQAATFAACVEAALSGDAAAYRRLLRDVGQLARAIAQPLIARCNFPSAMVDDVVQETLFAVHQRLPAWDGSRPLETWVIAVARNKAVDAMREAKIHRFRPIDQLEEAAAPAFASGADSRIDVPRLMARLTPRGREIVTAVALREESVEDVAARLAMSKGAVRVALHRAIRRMAAAGAALITLPDEEAETRDKAGAAVKIRRPVRSRRFQDAAVSL